jgi:hypothetical protein
MTADSYGPKNQPRFDATKPPDLGVDETLVSDFAALVGNRKVGTTAERNAAASATSGKEVWEGLQWEDTDLKGTVVWRNGSWENAGPRSTNFQRQGSADTFNSSAGFTDIHDGTLVAARAGSYLVGGNITLSGTQGAVANWRLNDARVDVSPSPKINTFQAPISWGGGDMRLLSSVRLTAGVGTVYSPGTNLWAVYLGPLA